MLRRARSLPLSLSAVLLAPLAAIGCGGGSSGAGGSTTSATTSTTTTGSGTGGSPIDAGTVDDIMTSLPASCAFDCQDCPEPATAFDCPTLRPWDQLPHDDLCGTWDGKFPDPVPGKCTASEPSADAAAPAGAITGGVILPDGHRILPAGREVVFDEADLHGGFPMSVLTLSGTHFALVSDGGIIDNALRLVDLQALAGSGNPLAGHVAFPQPSSMFYGMVWLPPNQALASGGGDGIIYAFDVDTTAGTIKRAPARDVQLGLGDGTAPYFSGAMATSADGTKLLVAPSDHANEIRVYSLAAADYGTKLGAIPLGTSGVFDLQRDPFDASGNLFYATDIVGSRLLEIDFAGLAVKRTVALDKNPAQLVFLDATYAAVTEQDSDELAVIDRAAGTVVAQVPIFAKDAPHGVSPSALAYDSAKKKLYATLAGSNAVEVFDVSAGSPPTVVPAGRIPTGWWPTGVAVNTDGTLVVISGKGHGTGTDHKQYPWASGPITERMRGSIQHVPNAVLADLTAQTAIVDASNNLAGLAGGSKVTCPSGADDFPIPSDNKSGPSALIKHVILVVRENKTYDGVLGDLAEVGNGDPTLIMAKDTATQSKIWQNARSMAKAFTNFDNFYTDAEQSIQGHTWTVFGRTTDYMERTWLDIWGRASRPVTTTIAAVDNPLEGGVFAWFTDQKIGVQNMGELIGNFTLDPNYPGLFQSANLPDVQKSCYMAGRIRLKCDLAPFTYATHPNDHTAGGSAGAAAPEVMIAVNDEASGMLLDALSHSPMWKDSLLIITEDDPQDGGDHIDLHRTLLFMASPWVKRKYVSHGHYDMASVYKLVAHIFGIPYHNDTIQNAMVPFDAFTSTPDYSPFTYIPRTITAPCNAAATQEAKEAERWDFTDLDDQPGLSQQIMRMMRDSPEKRGVRSVR